MPSTSSESSSRPVPIIAEREIFENLTTCLAMILAYHGSPNLQDLLRLRSQLDCHAGASFATLVALARDLGFDARGYALDDAWLDEPDPELLPCIIQYTDVSERRTGGVVLERVSYGHVTFISTRSGRKQVDKDLFRTRWRRMALVVTPTDRALATDLYRQWTARTSPPRPQHPSADPAGPHHDLIIIGAGPAGIATALQAQAMGLRGLLVERGAVAESLRHFPPDMELVSPADDLQISGAEFAIQGQRPTAAEAVRHYEQVIEQRGLDLRSHQEVLSITRHPSHYAVTTTGERHLARHVVVATGYHENPRPLAIPGMDLPHVRRSYSEAFAPTPEFRDRAIAVIGGGVSAVSAALALHDQGARVTLIHRSKALKYSIQEEGEVLFPTLGPLLTSGQLALKLETELLAITERSIELGHKNGQRRQEPCDLIFILIGYTPHVALLEDLGVEMFESCPIPAFDFTTFETSSPGLYVIGTAKGFGLFRHFPYQAHCICQDIARR